MDCAGWSGVVIWSGNCCDHVMLSTVIAPGVDPRRHSPEMVILTTNSPRSY